MKTYKFNTRLLQTIHHSLGRTYKDIADSCDFPETSFRCWRKGGDIRVSKLVKICNTFRISISDFIYSDEQQQVFHTAPLEDFTPIEWRVKALGDDVVGCDTINEAIERLDIGLVNFYRRFRNNEDSILTICEYLELCNNHNIYPGNYLVDYNKNIILLPGFIPNHESVSEQMLKMRKRIKDLEMKNKILQAKLKKIKAEQSKNH